MPVFEMPLEKLYQYDGRNPRPADFDDYWQEAMREMRACRPAVEIQPAGFQAPFAECFNLYFTGVRGARIHAKYVRPRTGSGEPAAPGPALLQFHGYTMDSGDWTDKLPYAAAGFSVVSLDCRGQGGLSEDVGGVSGNTHHGHIIRGVRDNPQDLLFRQIFLDTAQLASIVMEFPDVDPDRVAVMGWSQGGGLALACAALVPQVQRVISVYPFLCDYRRVWDMDLAEKAYGEIVDYFRRFDPRHEHEEEFYCRLGYIDVQYLTPRIRGEVLMATALMDTICPPSTQFAAFNKIPGKKSVKLYHDFGHENLPG
ncbi:MAG: alpha/beta fold hydrolase, partial [Spirochaeta sp.]